MKEDKLSELSMQLSVDILKLAKDLRSKHETVISNQIGRSGTSIGANIHEANFASSKADFINKFQIALKECYATEYWLEIFRGAEIITEQEFDFSYTKCNKIRKLLSASLKTAKQNNPR